MKQLVTEVRKNRIEVQIHTSYPETHPVFSKKEREEVVDGINTYYWVEVANDPVIDPTLEPTKYYSYKDAKKTERFERKKELRQLREEKKVRIAKYRAYIESIYYSQDQAVQKLPRKDREYNIYDVITEADFMSGSRLESLENKITTKSKLGEQKQAVPSIERFIQIVDKVIYPKGSKNEQ